MSSVHIVQNYSISEVRNVLDLHQNLSAHAFGLIVSLCLQLVWWNVADKTCGTLLRKQ